MTAIDTIIQSAGTLAEGYEPEALARAFWTYVCEPNDLGAGGLSNTSATGAAQPEMAGPQVLHRTRNRPSEIATRNRPSLSRAAVSSKSSADGTSLGAVIGPAQPHHWGAEAAGTPSTVVRGAVLAEVLCLKRLAGIGGRCRQIFVSATDRG
jgi:hypothetical protein